MTALTAVTAPEPVGQDAGLPPVPWRRMAWVVWRQHRAALGGVAALLGALAVYLGVTGLRLHHAYATAAGCHPAGSPACSGAVNYFEGINKVLANGYLLLALPALVGAFVGAPVLARELETGTCRYVWTQGFGRWRWTLAKLAALAVVVAAAAGAMTALFSWYYQPYLAAGNQGLAIPEASPLGGGLFGLHGVAFAAWTLAAFAIAALAGALIRRVVPAIAATLASYTGLAVAAGSLLRPNYLPAVVTSDLRIPGSAWILSQRWVTGAGQPVTRSALGRVLRGTQFAGKGGVPDAVSSWRYLVRHGYTQWTTYQPASRFWPFQSIEGGWLLALSVLLVAATIWLVRRDAA